MHELWTTLAGERGITEDQAAALDHFLVMLQLANEKMNLTRVADPERGRIVHVADALTLLPHIPAETKLLADVGSGGGVPGIVMGVMLPEVRVVLIEATQKKAKFLEDVARQLRLKNVEVRAVRAEDAGRSDLRDACDVVTCRAVGALAWVVEWCLPLTRKGGLFLSMKGPKLAEEIPLARRALHACHGGEPEVIPVVGLPDSEGHVICKVVKLGRSDTRVPRGPTVSKGKPL